MIVAVVVMLTAGAVALLVYGAVTSLEQMYERWAATDRERQQAIDDIHIAYRAALRAMQADIERRAGEYDMDDAPEDNQ